MQIVLAPFVTLKYRTLGDNAKKGERDRLKLLI